MSRARMPRTAAMAIAVAAGVASAVSGCSATSGTPAPSASLDSSSSADAQPATITVFAAASLTEAFDEIAAQFEAEHPSVEVVVNVAGSAALAQQIIEGAPADVFASADAPQMQVVVDAGLAVDPVVFATNTLELVVPAGNPAEVTGIDDLANPGLRIALCDPSVPCGAASERLLEQAGVTALPDTLESDVKAVLTKVTLGEVDAALVYRTDVTSAGDAVDGIEVPGAASVVNRYPIDALTEAAEPESAADFVVFVTGAEGRAVVDEFGFGAP
jgi:molybdate transport system substrate-binding protein